MSLDRSKNRHAGRILVVLALVLATGCGKLGARSDASKLPAASAVLTVDTSRPGYEFAPGAVGLSTEASELGAGYLRAQDHRLVRLMRLLGPSVLRIGGNVDRSWWTSHGERAPAWATSIVTPANLSSLHRLLRATGWRVLLGVDLGHFEPARVADEVRHASKIFGRDLAGIEIGNEPDGFSKRGIHLRPSTYNVHRYLHEAEIYRQVVNAAAPGVAIDGPALSETRWLTEMGAAVRIFTQITQHYYPFNTCVVSALSNPQPTALALLSPAVRQQEDETLSTLARVAALAGRSRRIGETNSVGCQPSVDANPAFAGALWSLDWALRAGRDGVRGLNFWGLLTCDSYTESPICAADQKAAEAGDIVAQPEYYGLLAARQLEGGRFVATRVSASHSIPNLTTWATLAANGTIKIAIIDMVTGGAAQSVSLRIAGYRATQETLVAPSIEATSGIALGDAMVTSSGQWRPRPVKLSSGSFATVIVHPGSAAILTLRPTRAHG